MKTIVFGAVLCFALSARADLNPACKLEGLERYLGELETSLKASPAYGHAGGHYGRALMVVQKSRVQIAEGCNAWVRAGMKPNARPAAALPERAPAGLDPRCGVDGIELSFRAVENAILSSPAYGHAAGHLAHALDDLIGAQRQVWDGCRAWSRK